MANIEDIYTGDGTTKKFNITFEYLRETDVKATINNVTTTAFTFANATTLEFTNAPPNGEEVRILRDTGTDELITTFFPGSAIRAQDLNDNANQVLFVGQETKDRSMVTTGDTMTGELVMANTKLSFTGANTTNSNQTKLSTVEPTNNDNEIVLPNQSGCLPVLAVNSTTQITATPEELNILDGVTATAAELNTMDGITATTAELNIMDGVTATTAELNLMDGVTATTAELNLLDGVTATTAELNIVDGVTATAAEINTLDGITATTAELNLMDGVTATTSEINVVDGVTATTSEINVLDGVTATTSELNVVDGITATTSELNILDGVTATKDELNTLDGVNSTLSAADLNQLDSNTLSNAVSDWTSTTTYPSAAQIESRISTRIEPLGGFEAIADQDSFPATQPPVGTIISIANAGGMVIPAASGNPSLASTNDAEIINTNTAVTIKKIPPGIDNQTVQNGIGMLVISTGANHEYDFHRVVATNGDVISLSQDINDFNNRYRFGATDPTVDNDTSDLFFNTTSGKLKIFHNSAWTTVYGQDAVEKTSATGSGKLPLGTTQERDNGNAADQKGFIRYNTSDNKFEGHDDAGWHSIAAEGNTVSFAGLSATGVVNFDISQLTAI